MMCVRSIAYVRIPIHRVENFVIHLLYSNGSENGCSPGNQTEIAKTNITFTTSYESSKLKCMFPAAQIRHPAKGDRLHSFFENAKHQVER
jgi:hypothetical protein